MKSITKTQIQEIKKLLSTIESKGYIDVIDFFKITSIHVDIWGNIYTGEPVEQVLKMYKDLRTCIKKENENEIIEG